MGYVIRGVAVALVALLAGRLSCFARIGGRMVGSVVRFAPAILTVLIVSCASFSDAEHVSALREVHQEDLRRAVDRDTDVVRNRKMAADIREQASLSVQRQLRFLQGLSDRDLARFVAERKYYVSSFQEVKELLEKYGRATAEVIDADYTASDDGNFVNNLVSLGIVARDYWRAASRKHD